MGIVSRNFSPPWALKSMQCIVRTFVTGWFTNSVLTAFPNKRSKLDCGRYLSIDMLLFPLYERGKEGGERH
jgi:hypothetical protein